MYSYRLTFCFLHIGICFIDVSESQTSLCDILSPGRLRIHWLASAAYTVLSARKNPRSGGYTSILWLHVEVQTVWSHARSNSLGPAVRHVRGEMCHVQLVRRRFWGIWASRRTVLNVLTHYQTSDISAFTSKLELLRLHSLFR
jgi:hypothetical protein